MNLAFITLVVSTVLNLGKEASFILHPHKFGKVVCLIKLKKSKVKINNHNVQIALCRLNTLHTLYTE